MVALDDTAWTALASMIASLGTLIAVLVTNKRVKVVDQKTEAIKSSVTTPNGDGRTIAEIVAEAHPHE